MLKAVREYKAQNAIFFDMDDISQGDSISH